MPSIWRFVKYMAGIIILYYGYFLVIKTWSYSDFAPTTGLLIAKQSVIQQSHYLLAFYTHVFSSIFVLLIGGLQFSSSFFRYSPRWHQLLGKFYVSIVLLLSAPSGFIIALYANGGLPAKVAFVFQSVLWWLMTVLALKYAREGNWMEHSKFMIRSYALALAAISLRIYAYVLPAFFGTYPIETYITNAWVSWVGNLLLAELFIYLGFCQYLINTFGASQVK
ncbi:DUF2306 domain-containing protein [Lewinella cohaerens]|uniref:DUF2306 domain-containing protein n=1 Tax=Lewinella cohaerens TaxID=70995 RepID=UPI00036A9ACB|nr:DUF2306 domain-containing protein [Lewinella cohaerens]